jgi:hypothetical protein
LLNLQIRRSQPCWALGTDPWSPYLALMWLRWANVMVGGVESTRLWRHGRCSSKFFLWIFRYCIHMLEKFYEFFCESISEILQCFSRLLQQVVFSSNYLMLHKWFKMYQNCVICCESRCEMLQFFSERLSRVVFSLFSMLHKLLQM